LLKNYDAVKILRNGINTVNIGKPNVGKSTLMNLLSGCERSIVTSVAGTTRDIVEETIKLGEIKLCLADTAGIRETNDEIEKIGVNRATERISSAQLIMAVFDSSVPLDDQDKKLIEFASGRPIIAVLNKSDLCTVSDTSFFETCGIATVPICAKNGEGADELRQCIENLVGLESLSEDSLILSSERQRACAIKAFNELNNATEILAEGMTFDAIGVLIDEALSALMELTGERVTEEVANEVFSRFCVGK
ncbi:MAG: GTP-binding protein, partial [Oscillospiraceae bacterium]